MDLTAHDCAGLAERFLGQYAREAQDYDLYALVDFYEGYRAVVRAKVSAMLAAQPDVPDTARRAAAEQAQRHLRVAQASERPALLPAAMICVGGVIASGKSTVADALASDLGCPVVDADRTRKHVVGPSGSTSSGARSGVHDPAWQGAYAPEATERTYAELLRRASVVLASGRSVVVDASFRAARWRSRARDAARTQGAGFAFVECRVPLDVCRDRLARRVDGPSEAHPAIFDAFASSFEETSELAPEERIAVDTTGPLERVLADVRARATFPHRSG
jgi:predicted kinase